jgi:hypothetical protein
MARKQAEAEGARIVLQMGCEPEQVRSVRIDAIGEAQQFSLEDEAVFTIARQVVDPSQALLELGAGCLQCAWNVDQRDGSASVVPRW